MQAAIGHAGSYRVHFMYMLTTLCTIPSVRIILYVEFCYIASSSLVVMRMGWLTVLPAALATVTVIL